MPPISTATAMRAGMVMSNAKKPRMGAVGLGSGGSAAMASSMSPREEGNVESDPMMFLADANPYKNATYREQVVQAALDVFKADPDDAKDIRARFRALDVVVRHWAVWEHMLDKGLDPDFDLARIITYDVSELTPGGAAASTSKTDVAKLRKAALTAAREVLGFVCPMKVAGDFEQNRADMRPLLLKAFPVQ